MAFCANCGSQVDGRFCPKCGAAVNVTGGNVGGAAAPSAVQAAPVAPATAGLTENVACALCYAVGFITGILFLVLAPYNQNRNIRFHAFQSIFYSAAAIALGFVFMFITIIMGGWSMFMLPMIFLVIRLGMFVLWLVLIIKAYQNQKLVLPVIGPLAEKQAGV